MKILHILWGFRYGGIETLVVNIANEQAALGHDVTVLTVNDMVDSSLVGMLSPAVRFENMGRRQGSPNPLPLLRLNMLIARRHPDVLHMHHVRLYRYILPALRGRWVTTQHSLCDDASAPWLSKNPVLVAISEGVRNSIRERSGLDSRVIVNGIAASDFSRRTEPYRGTTDEPLRLVQVGRMDVGLKGQDILLHAVKLLSDEGRDVRATFIGTGPDLEKMQALAAGLGIAERVDFLGARSPEYIRRHLKDSHMLVQPSRFEGFGLTITEGMAVGLPVLVSEVESQMEVIDGGRCGFHFEWGSAGACAAAIKAFMDSPDYSMVEPALKRVGELYDVKATARSYINLYDRL